MLVPGPRIPNGSEWLTRHGAGHRSGGGVAPLRLLCVRVSADLLPVPSSSLFLFARASLQKRVQRNSGGGSGRTEVPSRAKRSEGVPVWLEMRLTECFVTCMVSNRPTQQPTANASPGPFRWVQ